jgi:hypothetical protein
LAAMEPTAAELTGFVTLEDIAGWSEVSEASLVLFEASFGALRTVGFRGIGAATEIEFNAQVDTIRLVDGAVISFLAKHSLRLMGRVCRLAAGTDPTRAQAAAAAAIVAAAAPAAPAAAPPAPPAGRIGMTKLCDVVDQTNADEVPTVTDAVHLAAVVRYSDRMGSEPVEDVEPSLEQYTSIVHLLGLGAPPYVDFSIWDLSRSGTRSA